MLASLICFEGIYAYAQNPFQKSGEQFSKPVVFSIEKGVSRFRSQSVRPERAHPVVFNDLIYNISSRKLLVAFDFSEEKKIEHELEFAPVAGFVIDESGLIFVGGDDGNAALYSAAADHELRLGVAVLAGTIGDVDPTSRHGNQLRTGSDQAGGGLRGAGVGTDDHANPAQRSVDRRQFVGGFIPVVVLTPEERLAVPAALGAVGGDHHRGVVHSVLKVLH